MAPSDFLPNAVSAGQALFYHLIVCQNLRFIFHTVFFRNLADHRTRIPSGKAIRRDILYYNASRANHTAVSDRNAGTDHYISSQPAMIADMHRLCIAKTLDIAVFIPNFIPFIGQHRMDRSDDGDIRPKVAVVANRNSRVILHSSFGFIDICPIYTIPSIQYTILIKYSRL